MTDPFARLGMLIVRLKWGVLAFWIVLLAICGPLFTSKAATVLKAGGSQVPNSQSDKAGQILLTQFSAQNPNNATVVFHSASQTVTDTAFKEQVTAASQRLSAVSGVHGVISFINTPDPSLVSPDAHTALAIVQLQGDENSTEAVVPFLRKALQDTSLDHYVTGVPGINEDFQTTTEHDLRQAELVTIPLTILLLVIVFGTLVGAAIPILLGATSVALALTGIYLIGSRTDISIFALNVASMIGLGLGIDFSLMMVSRFREELAAGHAPSDAVVATMATAGRSITFSGVTVMLSMLLLTVLFNLVVVRSISLGVMLVAITALLAGLTLLPALLAILGPRIEMLRVVPHKKARKPGDVGFWYRLSHAIMRRPWVWLLGSLVLLLVLATPVRDVSVNGLDPGILPRDAESARGIRVLNEAFGANRLSPIEIVVQTDKDGVWKPEFLSAVEQLTNDVGSDSRTVQAQSIFTLARSFNLTPAQYSSLTPNSFASDKARAGAVSQVVNLGGDNSDALVTVISKYSQYSDQQQQFIKDLRTKTIPSVRQLRVYDVFMGGTSANFVDEKAALYDRFPFLVAAVLAMTYLILLSFFQSVFLPFKAILLNAASILTTYGVIVALFQYGWGSKLLGFDSVGKLGLVTPAILFVILFALSTDYEVFLLSRVKEYYGRTHDNEEAVATGLEHTAGIITAAGLLLIGVFGSFGAAGILTIKEIGVGLAVGVLLDSTIVRVIMVPATMRLTGNWNWWMPGWLRKIVPELSEGPGAELAFASGIQPAAASAPLESAPPRTPSPAMTAVTPTHLRPVGSSVGTDQVPLSLLRPLHIGRSRENELQLFDPRISRLHARIDYSDGAFMLTDVNSSNGVYVNGHRVLPLPERTTLHNGDRIQLGDVETLTFIFEEGASGQPSTAGSLP